MNTIEQRLASIKQQIDQSASLATRNSSDIELIAVSKTKPLEDVLEAINAGQQHFGENYVQELAEKSSVLKDKNVHWHFIGALQSNKTKLVAEHADWVHTIDRFKIAQRLNDQRPNGKPSLNILIQINIDNEPQKAGVSADEAEALCSQISALKNLNLCGLMAIPSSGGNREKSFSAMQQLQRSLQQKGYALPYLSMGMSGDFELAIKYGATHIRVGTAIFGVRPHKN